MTREEAETFAGLSCRVHWRDPEGDSAWTKEPLNDRAHIAKTWCSVVGFNQDGDLVVVGTESEDKHVSDRNVIPLGCIEKIERIAVVEA